MSYASDREAFIARIVREVTYAHAAGKGGPSFSGAVDAARRILRDAATHHRIAELECNHGLTDRDRAVREGCRRRIIAALAELGPGFGVGEFTGDPRGATVKITLPSGYGDDFGGRPFFCVPVRS